MIKATIAVVSVCAGVLLLSMPPGASAAAFESQFEIVQTMGQCELRQPGENKFVPATQGQKCAYGTVLRTSRQSSCVIRLSENNGLLVQEGSSVEISENAQDLTRKQISLLDAGSVSVNLEKGFRAANRLIVKTPSAICEPVACDFTVEYRLIADLKTTTVTCDEGEVNVRGDFFRIAGIEGGDQVTVAAAESARGDFIRIRVTKGDIRIVATGADGAERALDLTAGDVLTILTKDHETDPSKVVVIYSVSFANPELSGFAWQSTQDRPHATVPPSTVLPSADRPAWADLTIEAPVLITPTPIGKR